MKKTLSLTLVVLVAVFSMYSCEEPEPVTDMVTFEDLGLAAGTFWNGSDLSGGFTSGNIIFPNAYVTPGDYWSGFAYSSMTDVTTADYSNQYSCIAGEGAGGSATYGLLYSFSSDTLRFMFPEKVTNISLCNSTWAYLVMKNGDPVFQIEKMGGEDGSSPDYLKVIIEGLDEYGQRAGLCEVYLADFDTTRVAEGFVANSWTDTDLSEWGSLLSLVFRFETNVANEYGPLIPTYVCIDNIEGEIEQFKLE